MNPVASATSSGASSSGSLFVPVHLKDIVEQDDVSRLKTYIKNKSEGNKLECLERVDAEQRSLLMLLILRSSTRCALHLLKHHIEDIYLRQRDVAKRTALHYACIGANEIVATKLIKLGLSSFDVDEDGFSALHYAIQNGLDVIASMMDSMNRYEDVDAAKALFRSGLTTPLHLAASSGSESSVKELLRERKVLGIQTVHIEDEFGRTPLHFAVGSPNALAICRKLLSKEQGEEQAESSEEKAESSEEKAESSEEKAESRCDSNGQSPLSIACQLGKFDVALLLLKRGSDPNVGYPNPLFLSYLHDAEQFMAHLKSRKVDATLPFDGETFLGMIEALDDSKYLKMFAPASVKGVSSVNHAVSDSKQAPCAESKKQDAPVSLFSVCESGTVQTVKALVESGVDVTVRDKWGNSALMVALRSHNRKIAHFLAARALILVDIANNEGETPFLYMVKEGSYFWVQHLLKFGANPQRIDKKKNSAFHRLVESSQTNRAELEAIIQVLVSKKVNIDFPNEAGQTPLERAYSMGNMVLFQLLLQYGATPDPEFDQAQRESLLMRSCLHLSYEVARTLIFAGANRNACTYESSSETATLWKKSILLKLCEVDMLTEAHVKMVELLFKHVREVKNRPVLPADPNLGTESLLPLRTIVQRVCTHSVAVKHVAQELEMSPEYKIFQLILLHGGNPDVKIGQECLSDYARKRNVPLVAREIRAYQIQPPPKEQMKAEAPPPANSVVTPAVSQAAAVASLTSSLTLKPAASPKLKRTDSFMKLGREIMATFRGDGAKETKEKDKREKKEKKHKEKMAKGSNAASSSPAASEVAYMQQQLAERGELVDQLHTKSDQTQALAKEFFQLALQQRTTLQKK